jgi:cyclopropane fatty-acyl-phospholipid synthase-like methyltransferase
MKTRAWKRRRLLHGVGAAGAALALIGWASPVEEIPFVPTPMEVVDRMLELAEVKKGDVVYDLGSGDGRIVIRAAKKYGAKAVGIEMDSWLIAEAREKAKQEGVERLVEFRNEDALQTDVSAATVITLYMLPWFNEKMQTRLQSQLKPGSRVVAHDYGIEGWPATKVEKLPEIEIRVGGIRHQHVLYLWRMQ